MPPAGSSRSPASSPSSRAADRRETAPRKCSLDKSSLLCKPHCVTNLPVSSADDPRATLTATRDLSRRVRSAQRGAWFPLLVFAGVTLVAIPFNRYGPHPRHCGVVRAGRATVCEVRPEAALWYWPIAILVGYAAISWFYLRRSRERGIGTRAPVYVAVGAVLAVVAALWAFWAQAHPAALAEILRPSAGDPGTVIDRLASPAGAIGLALLLLAWIERSWPLLALTVGYLVVAVTTVGLGSFAHPTPWAFLPHLLVDAAVLLAGGIALALAQRAHARSRA
jgi:hypothetical protein